MIKKWISGKIKEIFESNLSYLVIGQIFAQGLAFLLLPFINRLFSEDVIGQWAIMQSIAVGLFSFAHLRTDLALMQSRYSRERSFLLGFGFVVFLSITLFLGFLSGWTFWSEAQLSATILMLYLFGFGFTMLLQSVLFSLKDFKNLLWIRVAVTVLMYVGAFVLYPIFGDKGLIYSILLANFLPIPFFLKGLRFQVSYLKRAGAYLKFIFRTHGKTLSFTTVQSAVESLNTHVILILMSNYFPLPALAAYFMAEKLCVAPITILGSSVNQYNFKLFTDLHHEKKFNSTVLFAEMKKWLPLGLLFYVLMFVGADFAARLFYGKNVIQFSVFIQIFVFPSFFRFIYQPASSLLIVLKKQKLGFFLSCLFFCRIFVAVYVLSNGIDIINFTKLMSFFMCLYILLVFFVTLHLMKKLEK